MFVPACWLRLVGLSVLSAYNALHQTSSCPLPLSGIGEEAVGYRQEDHDGVT